MRNSVLHPAAVFLAALLIFGLATPSAEAQVLYGSLTGLVTDQSGASIPGAEINATNTQTGQSMATASDAAGRYSFVNVQAGTYDLRYTAQGFRTLTQTGIQVSVNAIARVDVELELGQVTEVITVEAAAATLQTEKADTSSEITSAAITQIPLPGFRNYQSLINLVPGATPARFQN